VICAETAHINVDECGAPERFVGCKLLTVSTPDGKLTPEAIQGAIKGRGDVHAVQPKVISITQTTECGTVYTPAEIRTICSFAHAQGMFVHMDGARLANAAVTLGCSLQEMTADCGVDILSLGGTKNGIMYGEAVVIFRPELSEDFAYYRKQTTQLASKMRFIAVQFEALFAGKLWKENAAQANAMAFLLSERVAEISGIEIVYPVESNAVFVTIPEYAVSPLLADYYCYISDEGRPVARLMTSFDTEKDDVLALFAALRCAVSS
jgi:threonine aldolase